MSVDAGEEYVDVWDETVRRARKEHRCDACRETIRRGDLYHRTATLYDGAWDSTNRCARCEAMFRFLSPLVKGLGDDQVCDLALNCGHKWQDNFPGEPPLIVQALAFLTQSEAQILLTAPKHKWENEEQWLSRVLGPVLSRKDSADVGVAQ